MSADTQPVTERPESATDITAWLDEKPTLARFVAAARRFDALHNRQPDLFVPESALILRNFTIEPIEPLLRVAGYRAGIRLDVTYSGYDPAGGAFAEPRNSRAGVVVLAMRLEELSPALTTDFLNLPPGGAAELAADAVEHVVSVADGVRRHLGSPILAHNFVAPLRPAAGLRDAQDPDGQINTVRRMNAVLTERVHGLEGVHVLDVDHLFSVLGLHEAEDSRGARVSDAPLSVPALRALADAYVRHIRALRGPVVKCVVVDCDNTLWGGVVGEDGIPGLALGETGTGRLHRDLQQSLLDLRRRGTVLAICSRNDEADVLEVLRSHPDALLGEDDFVTMRINWEDKAENLVSIAEELNLGLDQLLFIDDDPFECESIKQRLPEVRVLNWPGDLKPDRALDDLGLFDSLVATDEDRARTEMYRAEAKRHTTRQELASVEDYLRSLEITATIGRASPEQMPRLSQLTLRTNQFNLTTRRYDAAGLEGIAREAGSEIVSLDLRDRFGASGIVGCAILRRRGASAVIDTLLLSCRVIGRGAEALLVHALATLARDSGAAELIGEYIPSQRNSQVADFYARHGFRGPEEDGEARTWRWMPSMELPPVPNWLHVIDSDGILNER